MLIQKLHEKEIVESDRIIWLTLSKIYRLGPTLKTSYRQKIQMWLQPISISSGAYEMVHQNNAVNLASEMGHLNSWVVSHSALIIGTLRHALGCEFEPWWQQTLFQTQAQHLCFLHDYIWFIWFDTIICLANLSCELWNRKLKIKEFKKNLASEWLNIGIKTRPNGLKSCSTSFYLKISKNSPRTCPIFWIL